MFAIPVTVARVGLGIGALGSMSTMTPAQIFQTALNVGFPASVAEQMTAIALRESNGNPNATNLTSGEQSYGLWQINIQGNPGLMGKLGITDPNQLLDPNVNAQAAFLLYGGNPNNLNTAWYINQPGYSQGYLAQLPVAQQAAIDVMGAGSGGIDIPMLSAGIGVDLNTLLYNADGSVNWLMVVGIGLIGYLGLRMLQ